MTNLNQFKEKIEGKGNYRFRMKAEQYEDLKAYMYDKTELAVRVNQMGWNMIAEDGFFAFSNGIVYNGKWCEVDEYGIVRLKNVNVFLPAFSKIYKQNRRSFANERRFIHNPLRRITAEDYFGKLIEVYGSNAVVGIAYYLATIFRDIIFSSTHSFPLLFVYGKKGTGKTELCISLTRLFQEDDISSLASTTLYAMGEKLAQVSNGLVYFDEYKKWLNTENRLDLRLMKKFGYNVEGCETIDTSIQFKNTETICKDGKGTKVEEYITEHIEMIESKIDTHNCICIEGGTGIGKSVLIGQLVEHYNGIIATPFSSMKKVYANENIVDVNKNDEFSADIPCVMTFDRLSLLKDKELSDRVIFIDESHILFCDRTYRDALVRLMAKLKRLLEKKSVRRINQ